MIKGIRRWLRKDDGVTAVEFSLVALPLFTIILGIIELSLFFASGDVLEGASAEAARRIRTGQVASAAAGLTDPTAIADAETDAFEQLLCDGVGLMLDCTKIQYEVIRVADGTFATAGNIQPVFNDDGELIPQPFSIGSANDVVLVRTYYKWEFLTPFIGTMLTAEIGA